MYHRSITERGDKPIEGTDERQYPPLLRATGRYVKINVRAMTDLATKGTIPAADTLFLAVEFLVLLLNIFLLEKIPKVFRRKNAILFLIIGGF
jgi:hypothetical protein